MKKVKVLTTAIALFFAASSFAINDEATTINSKVNAAFKKDFATANTVVWQKKEDVYFATFQLNNIHSEAAFNEAGELIALSKTVATNQLPLAISVSLSNTYQGYTIAKNATEIMYENQTHYYLNISNGKTVIKLKCAVNGDIVEESKVKM